MTEKVLFVDDDELILSSYERSLRKHFTLDTAVGPVQALEKIASSGPFAVIVSDMRMPQMTGLEMLHRVRTLSPDSIRLILTGNADLRTAIDAVNEGHLFRFLEKPCPNETMGRVLTAALEQYRLERSERDLLEKTLQGSVKVLTDVLGLVNPEAFSTASRITFRQPSRSRSAFSFSLGSEYCAPTFSQPPPLRTNRTLTSGERCW
jgi:DNA-binding NtrC family response regulator